MKVITTNKRAYFDYEILETYEAGLELFGFEVKSIKTGHVNLGGSYIIIRAKTGGAGSPETWLLNAHIPAYQPKNTPADFDPYRTRRLLLHKSEIRELVGKSAQKGLTLVPLRVYNKKARIKLEFGLAKHRKKEDKREYIKEREAKREIGRFA